MLALFLGHLFIGFQENWTILNPVIHISLMIHAIQRSILSSPPTCIITSRRVILFPGVKSSVSIFRLRRFQISPSFLAVHIRLSVCYGSTWLHCQSSMCLLCSCCTLWVLRLRFPWETFFVDLACGSIAPLIC
jgi:hypothetical protein